MSFKVGDCVQTTFEFKNRIKENANFYDECTVTWVFSFGYEIRKNNLYKTVNENDVFPCSNAAKILEIMDIHVDADLGNDLAIVETKTMNEELASLIIVNANPPYFADENATGIIDVNNTSIETIAIQAALKTFNIEVIHSYTDQNRCYYETDMIQSRFNEISDMQRPQ